MTLTKSKYLAGCQCPKRLWLSCFAPDLAADPDGGLATRLETGTEVGRHAHGLFAGGVLVEEDAWRHGEAVARTGDLLANPNVPAIFEAAFEHAGVRIRVDVLERLGDHGWGLREVKSATSVKAVHLDDLALQRFVIAGCGLRVPSVELIHVNREYVRGERGIDWHRFFVRVELATEVSLRSADVPARLAALQATLALSAAPDVEPSPHCFAPYNCEFWTRCTRAKPEDWIFHLPRLRPRGFAALRAAGVEHIVDVPDDFPLTVLQGRAREVWRSNRAFVSDELSQALESTGPPADYLDFETISPALPLYAGTRPYEQVPLQWSLHRVDREGAITHHDFLADGRSDPRPTLAESLLEVLAERGCPIIVYSGFERRILDALTVALPDRAEQLGQLAARLVDLLPVVRRHVYDAAFGARSR